MVGNPNNLKRMSIGSFTIGLDHGPSASFRRTFKGKERTLPNYHDLRKGDVIVTRAKKPKFHQIKVKNRQSKEPHLIGDVSNWTHAALYVGQMHVAESVVLYLNDSSFYKYMSGIRITPITEAITDSEYRVMRPKNMETPESSILRREISNYALLDFAINRRIYSGTRVMELAATGRTSKLLEKMNVAATRRADKSIICSEYVLECVAAGGSVEYNRFFELDTNGTPYFPADFVVSSDFEPIVLEEVIVFNDKLGFVDKIKEKAAKLKQKTADLWK